MEKAPEVGEELQSSDAAAEALGGVRLAAKITAVLPVGDFTTYEIEYRDGNRQWLTALELASNFERVTEGVNALGTKERPAGPGL